jgi:2-hydroxychromene-2-carboxylate isomerase
MYKLNISPIEFYFDFLSPYAYFASTRLEAIATRHDRIAIWRPVLLGVTVMKIMGLKPLMETPLKRDYLLRDGPRMAKLFGVPFRHHGLAGINSLAALRAFVFIDRIDAALAKRFAQRVFACLWVDGRDITPVETIVALAATLGIDGTELTSAITSSEGKHALEAAVAHAIDEGVFGVPFFVVDGEPIWGSDRLWMLEHWLTYGSWEAAPSVQLGP